MSDREDNRSEEEDSDEEGGGMKPAYSLEDLMGEEDGKNTSNNGRKATMSRSTMSRSHSTTKDVNGDLNHSEGPETSEAAKDEDDDRIYANPATIRERKHLSRSSGSTDHENVCEKTAIKSNLGAKSDCDTIYVDVDEMCDDGQKGGTLVPGEHTRMVCRNLNWGFTGREHRPSGCRNFQILGVRPIWR